MNRRSLRNRIFDENELESESSELETSSEYEENDDERSERSSDDSLESDSSDIEPLSQEILEGSAVNLDIRMNSKNGLIEYTKEPFVRGRRFSFRHQSNVSKGIFYSVFLLFWFGSFGNFIILVHFAHRSHCFCYFCG